jgi:glutamate carboxypeptidase
VDVRFSTVAESQRIQSFFDDLPQHTHVDGVRVEIKGEISRPPMAPSEPQRRLWQAIAAIGQGLGLEMKLIATGGCSDGNYTAALGIPTIDAMGPQGGDAHNSNEYVELNSVTPNIHLICQILAAAAEGNLP